MFIRLMLFFATLSEITRIKRSPRFRSNDPFVWKGFISGNLECNAAPN